MCSISIRGTVTHLTWQEETISDSKRKKKMKKQQQEREKLRDRERDEKINKMSGIIHSTFGSAGKCHLMSSHVQSAPTLKIETNKHVGI